MADDHDTGYKQLFSHPEMVRDLLSGFVPYGWAKQLDVSAFERVNASYVSDNGRQRHDDMVWKLRLGDEWLYLYILLEFQARTDPWMALRMQVYVGLLCQDLVKRRELGPQGKLPPVLPIVLYHGAAPWRASADLAELLLTPPPGLAPLQPAQRYLLIDRGRYDSALLATQANLVAALFRLEHSRNWQDIHGVVASLLAWLHEDEHASLRASLARWIVARLRRQLKNTKIPVSIDLPEVHAMITQEFETWADELEYNGLQKGLQQGRREGLERGLEQGRQEGKLQAERARLHLLLQKRFGSLPPVVAAQIEAAQRVQIEQWFDRLFDARDLDEIFAAA